MVVTAGRYGIGGAPGPSNRNERGFANEQPDQEGHSRFVRAGVA